MLIQKLFNTCEEPWLLYTSVQIPEEIMRDALSLNARNMTTGNELYNELSSKLDFPDYFGRNLNALLDMLCDLEWLSRESYIILIHDAEFLLSNESSDAFAGFLETLYRSAKRWSMPIELGELWDRASIPFHVIFQVSPQTQILFSEKVAETGIPVKLVNW